MNTSADYQRFDTMPEGVTVAEWKGDECLNIAAPLKWSSKSAVPAIGAEITVTMNGIGHGIVRGYFTECGWFGLLVELANPPQWWIDQNKHRKGSERWAHIFGPEFK